MNYQILAKFYNLFDLIFLLNKKGTPRKGLPEEISNQPLSILDVCVGTALSSISLAIQNPHNQITGIDTSEGMLAIAKKKVKKKGISNIELKQMSATDLKFKTGSFDVVMVSFALHEFEAEVRDEIIKEMVRILKAGGRLCVIDFARQNALSNRVFISIWKTIEPSCFTGFLKVDWRKDYTKYDLVFDKEREFAFSKMYLLHKK